MSLEGLGHLAVRHAFLGELFQQSQIRPHDDRDQLPAYESQEHDEKEKKSKKELPKRSRKRIDRNSTAKMNAEPGGE